MNFEKENKNISQEMSLELNDQALEQVVGGSCAHGEHGGDDGHHRRDHRWDWDWRRRHDNHHGWDWHYRR